MGRLAAIALDYAGPAAFLLTFWALWTLLP
jgi:hypothetical protein